MARQFDMTNIFMPRYYAHKIPIGCILYFILGSFLVKLFDSLKAELPYRTDD